MNFIDFDERAAELVAERLRGSGYTGSDFSQYAFLSWFDAPEYAERDGAVFLRAVLNGELRYWMPLVPDGMTIRQAVEMLPEGCAFYAVTEPYIESFGGGYVLCTNRDWSEYIYKTSDFTALVGKRYAAKRNHISKFLKNYVPQWSRYTEADHEEFEKFEEEWIKARSFEGRMDESAKKESAIVESWLRAAAQGKLICEILRVDDKMAGISIAEIMPSGNAVVMYEKADIAYEGIYSYLAVEFARRNLKDTEYINRQEDMGLEGLRKSKLSYYPEYLLDKYILTPENTLKRDENGRVIRPCEEGDSSLGSGESCEEENADAKAAAKECELVRLTRKDYNAVMTFYKCNIAHLQDKKFFMNYTDEELLELLDSGYMLAAKFEDHIIATCAIDFDKTFGDKLKEICKDTSGRQFYEFSGIMVCRHFRRTGLAGRVCGAVIKYAEENISNATLCAAVQHDNAASLGNLEKLGFKERARAAYKEYDFRYLTKDIN